MESIKLLKFSLEEEVTAMAFRVPLDTVIGDALMTSSESVMVNLLLGI